MGASIVHTSPQSQSGAHFERINVLIQLQSGLFFDLFYNCDFTTTNQRLSTSYGDNLLDCLMNNPNRLPSEGMKNLWHFIGLNNNLKKNSTFG